jgi:mono/diheme cytochrome c family protein
MQLKKIIWIVLILAIAFMLPACGGEEPAVEEEAEPIPAPTEEPTAAPTEETEPTEEPTAEEAPAEAVAAEELYQQNCAKCHGNDRNGGRGPALLPDRLTEDASVYVDIITNGSGGMPSFDDILTDEEIEALVAFIQSEPE